MPAKLSGLISCIGNRLRKILHLPPLILSPDLSFPLPSMTSPPSLSLLLVICYLSQSLQRVVTFCAAGLPVLVFASQVSLHRFNGKKRQKRKFKQTKQNKQTKINTYPVVQCLLVGLRFASSIDRSLSLPGPSLISCFNLQLNSVLVTLCPFLSFPFPLPWCLCDAPLLPNLPRTDRHLGK